MDENLPDKPVQMFDKTWRWSDAEKKKLTMFYKRQEVVENHDHPRLKWTR